MTPRRSPDEIDAALTELNHRWLTARINADRDEMRAITTQINQLERDLEEARNLPSTTEGLPAAAPGAAADRRDRRRERVSAWKAAFRRPAHL
jgi:hypothetical protein